MKKIAIFASGSGTNAQNIIEYFNKTGTASIEIVLSNRKDAYVLERAKKYNVPTCVFNRTTFYQTDEIVDLLLAHSIDLIVLAGFLWLVPGNILQHYPKRIINIHPALLPSYGGRGMFGSAVHEAVVANRESASGITIHYVNDQYDSGDVIHQVSCEVYPEDNADTLATRVHALEYEYFPKTIEKIITAMP